jgi:hypothetical protein
MNIPWIPIVVVVAVVAIAGGIVYLIIQSGKSNPPSYVEAQAIENDATWNGPGEYINLPEVWKEGDQLAHYGASSGPTTNGHVQSDVDYSKETSANSSTGLPPVGGPHWGQGSCGTKPSEASAYCGPVPWGVYREPWPAASMVHNMEHGGVVVWYNSSDTAIRDKLEKWVEDEGNKGGFVVMTPYPDIPKDTVALTAWARRDVFPVSDMTEKRVKDFIEKLNCHFNPEGFDCGQM